MGQKVNPTNVRLVISKAWQSRWFARGKDYSVALIEDIKIRSMIYRSIGPNAGIAKIEVERRNKDVKILIYTSKPGILIGWQGKGILKLRQDIERQFLKKVSINVHEIKSPDLEASLVAATIGHQISRRIAYRRATRQAIDRSIGAGAKGIKVVVSGRLRGAVIARSEKFVAGLMPTSTFKNNIDFAVSHAQTGYGVIGVKVWLYKGER